MRTCFIQLHATLRSYGINPDTTLNIEQNTITLSEADLHTSKKLTSFTLNAGVRVSKV